MGNDLLLNLDVGFSLTKNQAVAKMIKMILLSLS